MAPPPVLGITQESGLIARTSASQSRQSSKRRCCCQTIYARRDGSWGSSVRGNSRSGRGREQLAAMSAETLAMSRPAVDEDAVDMVAGHDLAMHAGHEVEVVWTQGAGDPQLRRGPVAARTARGIDGDPVGMRLLNVVVGGVRIGARHHHHPQIAASLDQVTEDVARRPAIGCGGATGPLSDSRRRSPRRSSKRRHCACGGSSRARIPGQTCRGHPRRG